MHEDPPDRWPLKGHILWAELHGWALTTDRKDASRWLARFATRIRCGDCRKHWEEILNQLPPDISSNDALFAWSVSAHNAVNRYLVKPEMATGAAAEYWKSGRGQATAAAARATLAEASRKSAAPIGRGRPCCPEKTPAKTQKQTAENNKIPEMEGQR